jgi:hypothetical protein
MAAATVVGTLVGGSAYIIKSFIDLLRTDKYALKTDFTQLKHTIDDLRINQAEIQTALQRIINEEPIFDQSSGSYQKVSSIGSIPSILKNSSTPKNVQFRYHP